MQGPWEQHYHRERSELLFPDENLVRLLKKFLAPGLDPSMVKAADIGCGSGRHLKLMTDLGMTDIIGTDSSFRALELSAGLSARLIHCDTTSIPLADSCLDIAVAWGSLHYAAKDDFRIMIGEIYRVLKKKGRLFATLRTSRDTYLRKGKHLGNDTWATDLGDIKGSLVSFFNEAELASYFNIFSGFQYGIIERSIMGDMKQILSHWVIDAEK